MININWDDPAARAELIDRIGIEAYNEAQKDYISKSTVATVGGHAIRPVWTGFGRLFQVGDTGRAFKKMTQAEDYARKNVKKAK